MYRVLIAFVVILAAAVAFGAVYLWQCDKCHHEHDPHVTGEWKLTKLVMHSQNGCRPCSVWKRHELPKAKADGVDVTYAAPDRRGTPAFDAHYCSGDSCKVVEFGNVPYIEMKKHAHSLRSD